MDEEQIISEALSTYRRFGYTMFFLMLAFAVFGLILWRWYAIPIAVVLGLAIGQIFSNRFYHKLSKRTGYDKSTLRYMMMEADDKRKCLR